MFKVNLKIEKNEDYSFEKDGIHYIFEFKGLTKDVKKIKCFTISDSRTYL